MKTKCKEIKEIQELATLMSETDREPAAFLGHIEECERCRFLWAEIRKSQKEIEELLQEETESWEETYIKAMASNEAVALIPMRTTADQEERQSITTRKAADSGETVTPRLSEFSTFTSEKGISLRILKDDSERTLHFYITEPSPKDSPIALYTPDLHRPLPFDESGYAQLPSNLLPEAPKAAILAPLKLE